MNGKPYILLLAVILACICHGQELSDSFYLVEGLDDLELSEYERELLKTNLTEYHKTNDDSVQLELLDQIIEGSRNDFVWPRYNQIMLERSALLAEKSHESPGRKRFYQIKHGNALNNIGFNHYHEGFVAKASEFYLKSLRLRESINDLPGVANSYHNLGLLQSYQGNHQKALEYFKNGLKIREELGLDYEIGKSLVSIGYSYKELGQLDSARHYCLESLRIRTVIDHDNGRAQSLSYLGTIEQLMGNLEKAKEYHLTSLEIDERLSEMNGASISNYHLGTIFYEQGKWKMALEHGLKAFELGEEIGYPANVRNAAELLSNVYEKLGNYKLASGYYKTFIHMRDSILNLDNQKITLENELEYHYDKKKFIDSIKFNTKAEIDSLKIKEHEATIAKQESDKYLLYIGLGFIALLLFISVLGFVVKQRVNKEIKRQRDLAQEQRKIANEQRLIVQEKNREVLDSITYAKGLQDAILPPLEEIKNMWKEYFLLYLPKDIVAGDFYWQEQTDNLAFFAVGDCTGHGVPGAMVSIVCSGALSRAVNEFHLTETNLILEKAREIVIQTFSKSQQKVHDGMDVCLISFNHKTQQLQFSGANNPLCIVHKNGELTELKGQSQPVGNYRFREDFIATHLDLQKGDTIYLFSDGFIDQFGGPRDKKFKAKTLKSLLTKHHELPLDEQYSILINAFYDWKGDGDQVDDICVAGIRF